LVILFLNCKQFINIATGVDAGVGHELESCTNEIGIIKMAFPGSNIVFVDTPGFDDTKKTDSDILKMISDWLEKTYVIPECTEDAADQ
jgi:predicted GTPase